MMRSYRGYVAGFAVLALVLSPALVSFAREDLEGPGPRGVESAAPETGTTNVRILGVNDLHGNLASPQQVGDRPAGGVAYLDAYMDRYERARPGRTIRVHAGDMVGGSPLASSRFHDEPTILAMNEMGFDVGTLGNHEFDDGGEEMMRLVNGGRGIGDAVPMGGPGTFDAAFPGAAFPYLAANTVSAEAGEPVLPPYTILEREGVRIGFVGVTTRNTPKGLMPETAAPFRFLDLSETVNRYVAELRGRGVEAIVVLAHAGGTAEPPPEGEVFSEAAEMSGAVDVVVAGHSHTVLNERVGDTLVVQAGEYGRAFSVIDLEIDRRTGDTAKARARVVPTSHGEVRPNETLSALVSRYEERVAPVSERVVAEAADDVTREPNAFGESALTDLVADAQRSFAGADLAFVNSAALRTDIQAGPVTYGELFAVQPFGADVVRLDLPGSAVLSLLEQQHSEDETAGLQVSGLSYSPDASAPEGRRVTEATLEDGTALDPDATYSVAADSFLVSGGGYPVFQEGANRRVAGGDVEALVTHLEGLPQPFVAPDPADGGPGSRPVNTGSVLTGS